MWAFLKWWLWDECDHPDQRLADCDGVTDVWWCPACRTTTIRPCKEAGEWKPPLSSVRKCTDAKTS